MEAIRGFLVFLSDILKSKGLIWKLAKNDLKSKFAGSLLGTAWAFVQPLATILVFWFVFEVGFRSAPVSDVPFIIWFTPAYLVWAFFSETLTSGTNCIIEYSYLVKKVNFRVSVIPIVKILSSAFVHLGFLVFIAFMMIACKVPLSIYNLQIFYYFFCTCVLLLGLCWMLAAIAPFVKDAVNIVNVFIQIGFWATPIVWEPSETMSPLVHNILKLNPMFYVCRGYRDSVINHVWFWQRGYTNILFWIIALLMISIGAYLFRKLRPQFADVL